MIQTGQLEVISGGLKKKAYVHKLPAYERKAYQAAHKILAADLQVANIGTPGGRQSKKVDVIAAIILEAWGKKPTRL